MMKVAKYSKNSSDVKRAIALLDSCHIDICKDEVLLNTVLDCCTRLRETRRLQNVLEQVEKQKPPSSVPTYSLLIKAYGFLRRVEKCWELWQEMTEKRHFEPSEITLGCMIDALVSNGKVRRIFHCFIL